MDKRLSSEHLTVQSAGAGSLAVVDERLSGVQKEEDDAALCIMTRPIKASHGMVERASSFRGLDAVGWSLPYAQIRAAGQSVQAPP